MRRVALLVCVLAVTTVALGEDRAAIGEEVDTVVPGMREQLRAQFVGSISDPDVRTLLGRIDERVMDATKVTGDERFAIVQLGDPENDPCCTTTILFENRNGVWTLVADIWQSH
jgi:hypothetical protein